MPIPDRPRALGPTPATQSAETLTVTIPAATILSNNTIVASPNLVVWATPGTLTPRGPLVEHNFETTIKQAASVIELTLDGDMWAPEVAHIVCESCPAEKSLLPAGDGTRVMTPRRMPEGCPCLAGDPTATYEPSHRNASFELLDAIHTVGERIDAEPGSWLYKMAPLLNDRSAFTPVLWRVSDFTLNLTLPQLIQYDIESPETLRFTTPPSSVLSDQPIVMPEIKIFPISGRVDVNGTLLDGVDENLMNGRGDGEYPLIITLTNETWWRSRPGAERGDASICARFDRRLCQHKHAEYDGVG